MHPEVSIHNPQSIKSSYAIKLDIFEGPLDLLLHLIQKNEMEITDIPIAEITEQYLEYLNFMELLDLDVASEFLVMAATLLYLKSQSILPSVTSKDEQPFKDREELVRQLLEYKQFKDVAQALEHYAARQERIYGRNASLHTDVEGLREIQVKATLFDLLSAFKRITEPQLFADDDFYEEIRNEQITVEEKIEFVEQRLRSDKPMKFDDLFSPFTGKLERIVTFLAILELIRLHRIIVMQSGHFEDIYIVKREE